MFDPARDQVVAFGEQHLRHLLKSYQKYYNEARMLITLEGRAIPRAGQTVGQTSAVPIFNFWARYTTNMFEPELRKGTGVLSTPFRSRA